MTDLTLNEYFDIPEDKTYNLLTIEAKKVFTTGIGEKSLKSSENMRFSNNKSQPDNYKILKLPLVKHVREILLSGIY